MVKQIKNFSFLDIKSVCDYACRFKMRPEDYEPIEEKEEKGWNLGPGKEEEEKPAFIQ